MSGFFHARLEAEDAENALQDTYVIARLCRAFFMHAMVRQLESSGAEFVLVIARLCRAFFMHNCYCSSLKCYWSYNSYNVIARLCRAFFMHNVA